MSVSGFSWSPFSPLHSAPFYDTLRKKNAALSLVAYADESIGPASSASETKTSNTEGQGISHPNKVSPCPVAGFQSYETLFLMMQKESEEPSLQHPPPPNTSLVMVRRNLHSFTCLGDLRQFLLLSFKIQDSA